MWDYIAFAAMSFVFSGFVMPSADLFPASTKNVNVGNRTVTKIPQKLTCAYMTSCIG